MARLGTAAMVLHSLLHASSAAQQPAFPVYPEQFTVATREYDSSGAEVLNQTLWWDMTARRTHMKAQGGLVGGGVLEQIMRCDTLPDPGFFVQASATDVSEPKDEWSCVNSTVDASPSSCQLGNFWENPAVYKYEGTEDVGVCTQAGKWQYRGAAGGVYAFWGTEDAPCATAELDGWDSTVFLWKLTFSSFVAGAPAFPDGFEVTDGVQCPPATPASSSSPSSFSLALHRRHHIIFDKRFEEGEQAPIKGRSEDLSKAEIRRHSEEAGNGNAAQQQHKIFLAANQSVTISWLTTASAAGRRGSSGSSVSWGPNRADLRNTVAATTSDRYSAGSYTSGLIHAAVVGPLEPQRKYFYSTSDAPDEVLEFTAPPAPALTPSSSPFTFAVVGDLGQTSDSEKTRNHVLESGATFVVHAGDLSYADCDQERWDSFAELMHPLSSKATWMPVAGNHEVESPGGEKQCNATTQFEAYEHRYAQFLPFQAANSDDNQYYSYDAAGVHFVMMCSYIDYSVGSPQLEWIAADLASVDRSVTPFVVAVVHSPWYNSNHHHQHEAEEFVFRQNAEPLLHAAEVDLMLAGHVHAYERSFPVYDNQVGEVAAAANQDGGAAEQPSSSFPGTVYITVGDGGNREGHAWPWKHPQPAWSAFRDSSFGHGLLTVVNSTAMHWTWRRNLGKEAAVNDEVWFHARL